MKTSKIILAIALISTFQAYSNNGDSKKYKWDVTDSQDLSAGTSDNINSVKMFTPDAKVIMGNGSEIRKTVETLKECAARDKIRQSSSNRAGSCVGASCIAQVKPKVESSRLQSELRSLKRKRDDIELAIAQVKCKLDSIAEETAEDLSTAQEVQ